MATSFETIRDYIRAALLDTNSEQFIYTDEALNSQIRFSILVFNDDAYQEGALEEFSDDLTQLEKAVFSLRTAIRILSGLPDDFAYKSPVLTVSRKRQKADLLSHLQTLLDDALGGQFAIAIDTDFAAIVQGFDRFWNSYDHAEGAWSGVL